MKIRESKEADKLGIETVHIQAFGKNEGPEIAGLVNDLLKDETAFPLLSLVAIENDKIVGHVLYTNAVVTQSTESVSAQLLAPLGVIPEAQNQGVGSQLIYEGTKRLTKSGVDLIFVLGHPTYYPHYGFGTAGIIGFEAPYPIAKENADAWMVLELKKGIIGRVRGRIQCAKALNQPQYWRE
ncbi:MAG: N-acetyltransferase [Candidatus Thiodiazotropha sp. (ex Lucina aurantia)]|uniref:N-acetyltransferase domain-containing protein n=2 Tax=Candidatus Thiodiazotropha TaxID=1913444 RepID=A0A7Z1AGM3_9GAMM|nr:N-acetyltransferase [Candidatus Thiodiazotropha endolucinida]MBT3024947.1 N-acetyltransferase [Candidatus Thiodiazotropha taylori]MBV2100258.1 N-acetyltransferase [Candidatus Thiodiazotropha sp. (ex Codakia orbicularis)]MBV2104665.1 N-acetyltransferase [Candidatus Thiodiazotropha sp. (ex Lucina aurantia)]MBV2119256.1 N-acetyltransferase [Candidatus Thiodiazotropha sp. (ex Lucina aurantia)]MCG7980180.1 N-acetyltransferase [Candidatus Thiodiazotropha taylori]